MSPKRLLILLLFSCACSLQAAEPLAGDARFDFACALLARGFPEEAAAEFTTFLNQNPNHKQLPTAVFFRAEAWFTANKPDLASRDYYDYLARYRGQAQADTARLRYGCCLFELGRPADAITALTQLATRKATDSLQQTASLYMARSELALGQTPPALARLQTITLKEIKPWAMFYHAEALEKQKAHAAAAVLLATLLSQYPNHELSQLAALRQGQELRRAGQLDKAARLLGDLLLKPPRPQLLKAVQLAVAAVRYEQGNYASARQTLNAIANCEKDDDALFINGLCALRLKEYPLAALTFAKVSKVFEPAQTRRLQAWASYLAGNHAQAQTILAGLRRDFPNSDASEVSYLTGRLCLLRKDLAGAISNFMSVRATPGPFQASGTLELAKALEQLGRFADAAQAYHFFGETFSTLPQAQEAYLGEARMRAQAGQYEAALPVYTRLTVRTAIPAVREYCLYQQALCYHALKQYSNMAKCLRQFKQEFPRSQATPETLYLLAWNEAQEKHAVTAIGLYKELISRFPDHEFSRQSHYLLAQCLYQNGQEGEAAAALHELITSHPDLKIDYPALLWAGGYFKEHKDPLKAEALFTCLLGRQPGLEIKLAILNQQAELKCARQEWPAAAKIYDHLQATLLAKESAGQLTADRQTNWLALAALGKTACLREQSLLSDARKTLDDMKLPAQNSLQVRQLFENGQLAWAEKKYPLATESFLRVGLLYDDEQLSGLSLLKAAAAALAINDLRKARLCYEELAGLPTDSYGQNHPQSPYVAEGRAALAKLEAGSPAPGKTGQP